MYFLLVIIIIFFHQKLFSQPLQLRKKKENTSVLIICAIIVFLAAFRSDEVGADTEGYRLQYLNMGVYTSFQDLVDRFTYYYLGYYIPCKFFSQLGLPVQVWFGFIEAIYLYSMVRLINKFSEDKIFSLLVFVTIGLFSFSMAGLKQTLAMALIMLSFLLFIEKRYLLSGLLVVLVYYTHQSALIFLGAFPMYYFRNTKWLIPLSVVACMLIFFNGYYLMELMVDALDNVKWEGYLINDSKYTYVTFIFYTVITIIAAMNFKRYNNAAPDSAKLMLALSIIGCGVQLLAGFSPSLFRLAYLYTPFLTLLLPNTSYYSKSPIIVRAFIMSSIIFYFLYTNRHWPYSFA